MRFAIPIPILIAFLCGASAFGQTLTNEQTLGTFTKCDSFSIPKDWKLISVDAHLSTGSMVNLWFQDADGDVYIVLGEFVGNNYFLKKRISKIPHTK